MHARRKYLSARVLVARFAEGAPIIYERLEIPAEKDRPYTVVVPELPSFHRSAFDRESFIDSYYRLFTTTSFVVATLSPVRKLSTASRVIITVVFAKLWITHDDWDTRESLSNAELSFALRGKMSRRWNSFEDLPSIAYLFQSRDSF